MPPTTRLRRLGPFAAIAPSSPSEGAGTTPSPPPTTAPTSPDSCVDLSEWALPPLPSCAPKPAPPTATRLRPPSPAARPTSPQPPTAPTVDPTVAQHQIAVTLLRAARRLPALRRQFDPVRLEVFHQVFSAALHLMAKAPTHPPSQLLLCAWSQQTSELLGQCATSGAWQPVPAGAQQPNNLPGYERTLAHLDRVEAAVDALACHAWLPEGGCGCQQDDGAWSVTLALLPIQLRLVYLRQQLVLGLCAPQGMIEELCRLRCQAGELHCHPPRPRPRQAAQP